MNRAASSAHPHSAATTGVTSAALCEA